MKSKIIKTILQTGVILTTIITCFTMSAKITPKFEEFETRSLTNGNSTSLEIGNVNLIACYGAAGNNGEYYHNNTLITDTTDYVITKEIDFQSDSGTKLRLEDINYTQDICVKAICLKAWCGEDFIEVRGITKFEGYTFNSISKTKVEIWVELSQITKNEILSSNGTELELIWNVE